MTYVQFSGTFLNDRQIFVVIGRLIVDTISAHLGCIGARSTPITSELGNSSAISIALWNASGTPETSSYA